MSLRNVSDFVNKKKWKISDKVGQIEKKETHTRRTRNYTKKYKIKKEEKKNQRNIITAEEKKKHKL